MELWFNRTKPIACFGKTKIFPTKDMLVVLHADPRRLLVRLKLPDRAILCTSLHAPQSGIAEDERREWWRQTKTLLQPHRQRDLLLLAGDYNARLPQERLPWVGDLVCNNANKNLVLLYDFLEELELMAPATHSALHSGRSSTWRHPSGSEARLDYVLIPLEGWHEMRSTSNYAIDAGNPTPDHFSTTLAVKYFGRTCYHHSKKSNIDWGKLCHPDNLQKLRQTVRQIPVAPWCTSATEQVALLNEALHQKLSETFPKNRSTPRKPYVSDDTWTLRQKRQKILAALRVMRLCEQDHSLQCAWARWSGRVRLHPLLCMGFDHFVTQILLAEMRGTAQKLRAALRQDRKHFIENVAHKTNHATPAAIYKELACLRAGAKFRKRCVEPLPMLHHPDGQPAIDPGERAEIWSQM